MTQPRILRAGLVGFGRLAERHYVSSLARIPESEITCVAEPAVARREMAQGIFPGARVYSRMEDLLDAEPLDALLVATPPAAHREAIEAAIVRRLPLFLEKPFLPPGELTLLRPEDVGATPLMINFNRRFWGPYRQLRDRLRGPTPGQMQLKVVLHVDPQSWNAVTDYRMKPEEGGVLQDLGSHALDLATFLTGHEPAQIRTRYHQRTGKNASATLRIRFAEGSSAVCAIAYRERAVESIAVRTDHSSFVIRHPMAGLRINSSSPFSATGWWADVRAVSGHLRRRRSSMVNATIHSALRHFFDSIRAGIAPNPGWDVALANARALEAAWLSDREKRPIELSEITTLKTL